MESKTPNFKAGKMDNVINSDGAAVEMALSRGRKNVSPISSLFQYCLQICFISPALPIEDNLTFSPIFGVQLRLC